LANLSPRVPERQGDLANGHSVAMRDPNLGVIVHRQHPCLRSVGFLAYQALLERMRLGWVHFTCRFHAGGGSLLRADYQSFSATASLLPPSENAIALRRPASERTLANSRSVPNSIDSLPFFCDFPIPRIHWANTGQLRFRTVTRI